MKTLSHPSSRSQISEEEIEADYTRLKRFFLSNNIATGRLKWQPLVAIAEKYRGRNIYHLIDDCKNYPQSDYNLAIEPISVHDYRNDPRYSLGLLPEVDAERYAPKTQLLLYFNRSYNANSLNHQLKNLEERLQYNPKELKDRLDVIYSTLRRHWPYTYMKLIPHGSYVTGLAFRKSFLNICIELDDPDMDLFTDESLSHIRSFQYPANPNSVMSLYKENKATRDELTNLIRLQFDDSQFEIDFNKEIVTESTFLIREYMRLDPRVKPFLSAIKFWGRDKSLFFPQYKRGVRFYSYTIMGLAYLAQLDPPVIPNLQHVNHYSEQDECGDINCRSKFKYWDVAYDKNQQTGIAARYHDCVQYRYASSRTTYFVQYDLGTNTSYWNSSNTSGVGELFLDFLHYYGYRFNFQNDAVSLKYGGKSPKKPSWYNHQVVIEDPFMSLNIGESASDFSKFIGDIRGSFTILQSGVPFIVMCKKIGDIMQYNSIRGKNNDRPAYVPFGSWVNLATSKSFLLIDLPAETEGSEYTDRIRKLFSTHGEITLVLNLDARTKQVFFKADTGSAKDIVLPTSFTLDGKTVHLVELYEYAGLQETGQQQQNLLS